MLVKNFPLNNGPSQSHLKHCQRRGIRPATQTFWLFHVLCNCLKSSPVIPTMTKEACHPVKTYLVTGVLSYSVALSLRLALQKTNSNCWKSKHSQMHPDTSGQWFSDPKELKEINKNDIVMHGSEWLRRIFTNEVWARHKLEISPRLEQMQRVNAHP